MPFPMMPGEAARPIMGYVRELESKVLALRADKTRFRQLSFLAGFAAGAAVSVSACLLLRYLH